MKNISKNEKGFSALEVILVIAVVALIGAAGYLVYKNHTKSASSVNKAATTTTTTYSPGKSIQIPVSSNGVIKIPEIGIELVNVPSSISDLTYYEFYSGTHANSLTTTPDVLEKNTAVQFSTISLTKLDHGCAASRFAIGGLGYAGGTYDPNLGGGDFVFVKQFNGFYIEYNHPQQYCSDVSVAGSLALLEAQTKTFETLVLDPANIQLIQ